MKTTINWKKGIFSNTSQLYVSNKQVGHIKRFAYKNGFIGQIGITRLEFEKKGIFSKKMTVIDSKENNKLAEINIDNFGNHASIILSSGKRYYWKYDNLWRTKWSIHNKNSLLISYSGQLHKGVIETETNNELLLLSGFIAQDYLKRKVAFLIAIFIPIFLREIM